MSPDNRMPDDRMTENRIRAVFDEPIIPLTPPPGTWERIEADAARRRRSRRLVTAGSAAAAVVVLAGGAAWFTGFGDGASQPAEPPSPTASTPVETPTANPSPSGTARPTPTGTATAAAGLPRGGPVPSKFVAVSASTTSGGYLYALGTAPCAAAPCTSLVRSHDGGTTWVGIPAPEAELPATAGTAQPGGGTASSDTVTDIRFATPRDGWAFGGALWQTHDGGATWQRTPGIRGRVLDLATNGTDVWAVASSCTGVPCPLGVQLLHARATGHSFAPVPDVTLPGAVDVHLVGGGGVMALIVGGPDAELYLLRTNGNWVKAVTPCAPPGVHFEGGLLAVAPPASGGGGLVAFCGDAGAGSLNVVTERSTDGGRSWASRGDSLRISNGSFSGTALTVDRVVVASGNPDLGGSMHLSYDGGHEYVDVRVTEPQGGWRWVAAAGGERVLALPLTATGTIYLSTDGGASFAARSIR